MGKVWRRCWLLRERCCTADGGGNINTGVAHGVDDDNGLVGCMGVCPSMDGCDGCLLLLPVLPAKIRFSADIFENKKMKVKIRETFRKHFFSLNDNISTNVVLGTAWHLSLISGPPPGPNQGSQYFVSLYAHRSVIYQRRMCYR